jgi:hypothetical protein
MRTVLNAILLTALILLGKMNFTGVTNI